MNPCKIAGLQLLNDLKRWTPTDQVLLPVIAAGLDLTHGDLGRIDHVLDLAGHDQGHVDQDLDREADVTDDDQAPDLVIDVTGEDQVCSFNQWI